jgi:FkbM family methyltransferase
MSSRWQHKWHETWGLWRSLLMYYAVPGRFARMKNFYGQFIQPDDLCFDIGAHVGNRLRVWQALGARSVAVEPQPALLRCLQRLFGKNPRITLVVQAVGATAGVATLHISSRTPTVTTLSQAWINAVIKDASFSAVQWDQQIEVPLTTLDSLIAEYGLPSFCKIDVEGFELEVLKGLSQPINALSFEYIPASIAIALGCIDQLEQLASYQYNYSRGETHQLIEAHWLDAAEMQVILRSITKGSGDVYARLLM